MSEIGGAEERNRAMLDRRTMLKGAAAAGAGIAAWSAPSITTLGFTPAYAQVCSPPALVGVLSDDNVSCNCGGDFIGYNWFQTSTSFASAVTAEDPVGAETCGASVTGGSVCSPGGSPQGQSDIGGVCVTPTDVPVGWVCQVTATITSGGTIVAQESGDITEVTTGSPSFFANLPDVPRSPSSICNSRVSISLACAAEAGCLP